MDFIIYSVNHLLQQEFNQTLGSEGVHIIDPFTGTGTFITRLLQSGLIKPEELKQKYQNEIHANELVLLAYYIAAINIEAAYQDLAGGEYLPFEGICLTDTFQMYEKDDLISKQLVENSERRKRQKALDIRVIIGNPPYLVGQKSENDNNRKVGYPALDQRISETFRKKSRSNSTKDLDNSYIRAIRWGADRLGDSGVLAFISGNGWLDRSFADGMRKSLAEEFDKILVFNLRGDVRKDMFSKGGAKEGGNIFDEGSMSGISIEFFVKSGISPGACEIKYYDIGDALSAVEKKDILRNLGSIDSVSRWVDISPNDEGDWINQRDQGFGKYIVIGDKKNKAIRTLFDNYSLGINTNRDSWCYGSSKDKVFSNIVRMVDFYNSQVSGFDGKSDSQAKDYIDNDPKKIKWSSSLIPRLVRKETLATYKQQMVQSAYRPFIKQWLYFDRVLNHRTGQMYQLFPVSDASNLVLHVSGVGARSGFSSLIFNSIPDLHALDTGQCFPLYLYDEVPRSRADNSKQSGLFDSEEYETQYQRRDAITDEGLQYFLDAYPGEEISKENIFFYVYGLLHSQEYRDRYADNLSKELPRIPCVRSVEDFWSFSEAGRELAYWHLNYETVEPYKANVEEKGDKSDKVAFYRVEKMKHPKVKNEEGKSVNDLTKVIYNSRITVSDIPVEAYDYVVNGKPAIEWVIERQCVKTYKDSGIVNDANDWANETMKDPRYPLDLLLRVIRVSLETNRIVASLPELDID